MVNITQESFGYQCKQCYYYIDKELNGCTINGCTNNDHAQVTINKVKYCTGFVEKEEKVILDKEW